MTRAAADGSTHPAARSQPPLESLPHDPAPAPILMHSLRDPSALESRDPILHTARS